MKEILLETVCILSVAVNVFSQGVLVSPDGIEATNPAISGDYIFWQQYDPDYQDWDIYGAEIINPENVFAVAAYDKDQVNCAVYDNKVVFEHVYSETDHDIWGAWINSTTDINVAAVSETGFSEKNPVISGNKVVYQIGDESDWGIYSIDFSSLDPNSYVPLYVTDFDHNQVNPDIYRDKVVWQDDFYGDHDVYMLDLFMRDKPGDDVSVAIFDNHQVTPAVYGDLVVWADENIYGSDMGWNILGKNTETGEIFVVTYASGDQINPDIYENLIVYQSNSDGDWDIELYNMTTDQLYTLTTDSADQINPVIFGEYVAWQDNSAGYWQIRYGYIGEAATARCENPPVGDLNGDCHVDFEDFADFAQSWLDCGLNVFSECP